MARTIALAAAGALTCSVLIAAPVATGAGPATATSVAEERGAPPTPKQALAVGRGGAVSSVDADASAAGLQVLRAGGNAVDAAVATAAALGVTEPYSAGIGGGGYLVHYDARTGRVSTIDGRETAPAGIQPDAFIDPTTGAPYPFTPDLVTSGVSVGVPGTAATWDEALDRWGTVPLRKALAPATRLAQRGFVVDETFRLQTEENAERFRTFTTSADLFLRHGVPAVGSRFRNPDLAQTYRTLGKKGVEWFYQGRLATEIARTVQAPPVSGATDLPVPPGSMTRADLAGYDALKQRPTHVSYRDHDVYGMAPSSSGGTTVGESLNILESFDLAVMEPEAALHHYLEATALAFADRGAYVGDPAYDDVPVDALLDDEFAAERACQVDPDAAAPKPVDPGDVDDYDGTCPAATSPGARSDDQGRSTTHLTTADRWGNVVAYTLTIEQTGGSGIVVGDRGFLLNNELTDFDFAPSAPGRPDPNLPAAGKRPRSSMSPTIALAGGRPLFATGSPGGATITTTVLQVLTERIDRGRSLEQAIAEPRVSEQNKAQAVAEPGFLARPEAEELRAMGHEFRDGGEIGAATGVEQLPDGRWVAAAEPQRRGGGAAGVVLPTGR